MEDCNICYQSKEKFINPSCGHKLCQTCFDSLKKNLCPYCRKEYNSDEISQKNYIYPPSYEIDNLYFRTQILHTNIPYARYYRNMERRRRRNLTFEQVKKRRQIIKSKMRRKWMRKNGRLFKIQGNGLMESV